MAQSPNILWVSFEDCYPYFGCYGDEVAKPPHLDRLAAEGAMWTRAFSTAPVCSPARSGVITGMYQTSIGTPPHRTGFRRRANQTHQAAPRPRNLRRGATRSHAIRPPIAFRSPLGRSSPVFFNARLLVSDPVETRSSARRPTDAISPSAEITTSRGRNPKLVSG